MPSASSMYANYGGMDILANASIPIETCDQRTFQIAMELSRCHLNYAPNLSMSPQNYSYDMSIYGAAVNSLQRTSQPPSPRSITAAALAPKATDTPNATVCVQVPSSEHVAEIVGKQGCKIKALRSKTITYIKTPVRGEEPVFVITGRREDVESAKAEILQAADHFTQIRAQRRLHPPPHIPGQLTIQLPVPLRLVGLIVGPKGQTIKKVQQDTMTYIITPGRDKDPVFEITGSHEGVQRARELIEDHVLSRTGNSLEELLIQQNDPTRQRSSSLDDNFGLDIWRDGDRLFGSSPDNLSGGSSGKNDSCSFDIGCWNVAPESPTPDGSQFFSPGKQQRSFSIANPGSSNFYDGGVGNNHHNGHSNNSMDHHRRINRLHSDPMPAFGSSGSGSNIWDGTGGNGGGSMFQGQSVGQSYFTADPEFATDFRMFKASLNSSTGDSACSSSPAESVTSSKTKLCAQCNDQDVVAAFVPCGHQAFCMSCARALTRCPFCHADVDQVIRIQSEL